MALQCAIALNTNVYAAGQTPPPMATVVVYNPGAAAVVVTSMDIRATGPSGTERPASPSLIAPTGPGMPVSVPAGGTLNIGPFPIVAASAANANSFQMVAAGGAAVPPWNPQPSQPPQFTLMVRALVYGSDGSANIATPAGLTVSYGSTPPLGFQGGFFNFAGPNNLAGGMAFGVL